MMPAHKPRSQPANPGSHLVVSIQGVPPCGDPKVEAFRALLVEIEYLQSTTNRKERQTATTKHERHKHGDVA